MKQAFLFAASAIAMSISTAQAAQFNISYTYQESSTFTASVPIANPTTLDPLDPGNLISNAPGSCASSEVPAMRSDGVAMPTVVQGTGTLDTDTGEIVLDPINYELAICSGSIGYIGWSQTLNGSFAGTAYTHTSSTVNGGPLSCENDISTGCGGAQLSGDACGLGDFGVCDAALDASNFAFSSLSVGGTGTYSFTDGNSGIPGFDPTREIVITIDSEIGGDEAVSVPFPAVGLGILAGILGILVWIRRQVV